MARVWNADTYAVVDVETTGFSFTHDRVIEVACALVRDGAIVERFSSLVNPGRPIPRHATSVHGIRDRDVADAPTLAALAPRLRELARGTVVVAHNARFDLGFLPMLADRPSLCTLRLARAVVDAPAYSMAVLRERFALGTTVDVPAHRALGDVLVTVELLALLLRSVDALARPLRYADFVGTPPCRAARLT